MDGITYGTGEGFTITNDSISTQLLFTVLINPEFVDYDSRLGQMFINHMRRVNKLMGKPTSNEEDIPYSREILSLSSFEPFNEEFAYKYINPTQEGYYKRGSFQLGTLKYYREIEEKGKCDDLEGYSILLMNKLGWRLTRCVGYLSGYHHYIFCMTSKGPSLVTNELRNNFGNKVLRIRLKQFADEAKKLIGAYGYYIYKVIYNDGKIFQLYPNDAPSTMFEADTQEVMYDNSVFTQGVMRSIGSLPHIFVKPMKFQPEHEIRISFVMPTNVDRPIILESKKLLDFIEFL